MVAQCHWIEIREEVVEEIGIEGETSHMTEDWMEERSKEPLLFPSASLFAALLLVSSCDPWSN
jgi:hypothetical protein